MTKKEKVSLIQCRTYDYNVVKESILQSFEHLGGIEKYIDKGDKVLLKLNLLMKKKPEEAATTHPIFTKALAEVLIQYGATVIIGDSPGGPFTERMLKGVYRVCGINKIAEETGAILNYNTNGVVVSNPDAKYLKSLTVTEMIQEVDKVISVSKLKTHGLAVFTGAVKNMFGIVPGLIKAEYHLTMPEIEEFSDALVDICLCGKPTLSFMDGIVGMEGHGPSAGDPREVGAVIASTSPYHLDVVATSIINLKPSDVPTIKRCMERGICSGKVEDIEIIGEEINKFLIKDFVIPETRTIKLVKDWMPPFVKSAIDNLTRPRPVFNHKDCIGCRDCEEACPPKVIAMKDHRPIVRLDDCIRCFCCQELCPKKAVEVHRPWMLRQMTKF
ncbi:DUF362 domain-containing protein [Alkaliphilus hydrothermalis]|uniref:Ferredoxin n=1 Tax=Alkaliphilus hydrothermalis TaxID=1482730 RepID=A0ABS2NLD0_9FIRM|nr:DUF362 domain-containing protein [Alkaliphilus hydrothermalis]MBM7613748.1 uncharacterized protein (DUF362 family)/Pyruvate/2-oxoacid:ferredoxin oxidoreductase delta subunit [Alkaliphilus hydrothermalis]